MAIMKEQASGDTSCPQCGGLPGDGCTGCGGSGLREDWEHQGALATAGAFTDGATCPTCDGVGKVLNHPVPLSDGSLDIGNCQGCNGSGRSGIPSDEQLLSAFGWFGLNQSETKETAECLRRVAAYAIKWHTGQPSRPVANGASEDGDEYLTCDDCGKRESAPFAPGDRCPLCRGHLREDRPVAVGSKARAEAIVAEAEKRAGKFFLSDSVLAALDRAQFFADEAVIAEIDRLASEILAVVQAAQPDGADAVFVGHLGLALATAVRKLIPARGSR